MVHDMVVNPETFDVCMYLSDYSEQRWELLQNICERLNTCRNGERYSGAKLEEWISG